ncbi:hypothetical protein GE118_01880 [Mycoplasma sp. NEAQ87857]|uniref:GA module-containing protein n=1 Tax=Mycoplasma sp. NEAQ87857 TaxID=2683967 RepID=UPI0013177D9A|nr:GA module-containing protein [Mycoplasma sp. NEAQ87857]QGZ97545.1 hypothetical protein GE118_01880 [Mycoplasma sp. NEAQ87857]
MRIKNKLKKVPFMVLSTTGILFSITSLAVSSNSNDSNYNAGTKKYTDRVSTRIQSTNNQHFFFDTGLINTYTEPKGGDVFTIDNTFYGFNSTYKGLFNSNFDDKFDNNKFYIEYLENNARNGRDDGIASYYKPDLLNNSNSEVQYLNGYNSGNSVGVSSIREFNKQNKYTLLHKTDNFPNSLFDTLNKNNQDGAEQLVRVIRVDDGGLNAKRQKYRFEFGINPNKKRTSSWEGANNANLAAEWWTNMNIVWSKDFQPVDKPLKIYWVRNHNNYQNDPRYKEKLEFDLKVPYYEYHLKEDTLGQWYDIFYHDRVKSNGFKPFDPLSGFVNELTVAYKTTSKYPKVEFGYPKIIKDPRLLEGNIYGTTKRIPWTLPNNGLAYPPHKNSSGAIDDVEYLRYSAGLKGDFLSASNKQGIFGHEYGKITNLPLGISDLKPLSDTFGSALQFNWTFSDNAWINHAGTTIYVEMEFEKNNFWEPSSAERDQDASYVGATNRLVFDRNDITGKGRGGSVAAANFWVNKRTTNRPIPIKIKSTKANNLAVDFNLPIADYKYYQKENNKLYEVQGVNPDPNTNVYNATNNLEINEYEKFGMVFNASSARDVASVNWKTYFKMLNPFEGNNFVFSAPSNITNQNRKWKIPRERFGTNAIGTDLVDLDNLDWNNALIATSLVDKNTYSRNFFSNSEPKIFNEYQFDWNDLFKTVFQVNKYLKESKLNDEQVKAIVAKGNEILKEYANEAMNKNNFLATEIYTTNDRNTILNNDSGKYIIAPYKTINYDQYIQKIKNLTNEIDNGLGERVKNLINTIGGLDFIDDSIKNTYKAYLLNDFRDKPQDILRIIATDIVGTSGINTIAKSIVLDNGSSKGLLTLTSLVNGTERNRETLANYKFSTPKVKKAFDDAYNKLLSRFNSSDYKLRYNAYKASGYEHTDLDNVRNSLNSELADLNTKYNALNGSSNLATINKIDSLDLFSSGLKDFYKNELYKMNNLDEAKKFMNNLVDLNGESSKNRDDIALYLATKYLNEGQEAKVKASDNYIHADSDKQNTYNTLLAGFKNLFVSEGGKYKLALKSPSDLNNQTNKETIEDYIRKIKVATDQLNGLAKLNKANKINKINSLDLFSSSLKNFYIDLVNSNNNEVENEALVNRLYELNGAPNTSRDNLPLYKAIKYLDNNKKREVESSNKYKYANNQSTYTNAYNALDALLSVENGSNKLSLITNPRDLNSQTTKEKISTVLNNLENAAASLNGDTVLNNLKREIDNLNNFSDGIKDAYKNNLTAWDWPSRKKTHYDGATDLTNELKRIDNQANNFKNQVERFLEIKKTVIYTKASNKRTLDDKISQINGNLLTHIGNLSSINGLKINNLVNEGQVVGWGNDLKTLIDALDGKDVLIKEKQDEIVLLTHLPFQIRKFQKAISDAAYNLNTSTNADTKDKLASFVARANDFVTSVNNFVEGVKEINNLAAKVLGLKEKANKLITNNNSLTQEERNNYNNASEDKKQALRSSINLSSFMDDGGNIKPNSTNTITTVNSNQDDIKNTIRSAISNIENAISGLNGTQNLEAVKRELEVKITEAQALYNSSNLDDSVKPGLLADINKAQSNKIAHNTIAELRNDIAEINRAKFVAIANNEIFKANKLKDQLDANHLNEESRILNNKITDLRNKINDNSDENTLTTYSGKLIAEVHLQDSRLQAKLVKDKMGTSDSRIKHLISDLPNPDTLTDSLNQVETARATLDNSYRRYNKDDILRDKDTLKNKIDQAKAKLIEAVGNFANIDDSIKDKFKKHLTEAANLVEVIKGYNNAVKVDKEILKIKTQLPSLTESDATNINNSTNKDAYNTALDAVKQLIDDNNKATATTTGFNDTDVADPTTFINGLESKLNTLITEYSKLNGKENSVAIKDKFIKELKEALEVNNLINSRNDLLKDNELEAEIEKAISNNKPSAVQIIGNKPKTKNEVDTNLTINIADTTELNKLNDLKLADKASIAANNALTKAIEEAKKELAKWEDANGEYNNPAYTTEFFNGIKDGLKNAITAAEIKNTQPNISSVDKANQAVELDKKLKETQLNTNKAKKKNEIKELNRLSDTVKNTLYSEIDNINEADIDNIVTKAKSLNDQYTKLANLITSLNDKAKNDWTGNEFTNSSTTAKNNLKQAYNALNDTDKVQNLNDANNLKGKSLDLNNITTLVNDLETKLNALDGNARLNNLKNDAKAKIETLSHLTNGQKTAFKKQIDDASLLDEITSNNDINNLGNGTILDKANKLNNTMESLKDTFEASNIGIRNKTDSSYINANDSSKAKFDNALNTVNNILNDSYNGLDETAIDNARDEFNNAIAELDASAAIKLVKDELNNLITIANNLKDSNKITGDSLTKLIADIKIASDIKDNNSSTIDDLNKAINDLDKSLIDHKSKQYIDNAKEVIDQLRDLNLVELVNSLETKVSNVETSLLTAKKITDIDSKLIDLDKWTEIDKDKIKAAKLLNKITNIYNKDLTTIIEGAIDNDLKAAILDLNNSKNNLNNLMPVNNEATNINDQISDLEAKLTKALNELTKATDAKDHLDSNLDDLFKDYIKNTNNTYEDKLKAFNKLNKLDNKYNEIKDLLNNLTNIATTNNYLLSDNELKDNFDNAKNQLQDLYQYNKANITNNNSNLVVNDNNFNNYISKLDDAKNILNDALSKLNGDAKVNLENNNNKLNLDLAKNKLQDLLNQANDWLNANTKDTDINLKGDLPTVITEVSNNLNDNDVTLNTINTDIDKLTKSLTDAIDRLNDLNLAKDKLNNIINDAEKYLKTVDDSDLNKTLLDAIEAAKPALNDDMVNNIIDSTNNLENVLDNTKLKNELIKAKDLKDSLENNDLYNNVVSDLNEAISNTKDVLDEISNQPITNDLKNKQKEAIKDLTKAIANAKLNKTIIDAKELIKEISDDKYKDINDGLNQAIKDSLLNNNTKSAKKIDQDNNKLINEIAKAKLDIANVDAKELLNELAKDANKNKELIDNLNNSIIINNNINKDDTSKVDQATSNLNNDINSTKAKTKINEANEIINNIDNSILNDNKKNELKENLNNLINKVKDQINDNSSKEDINQAINNLDKGIKEADKEVRKAEYDNSVDIANDLSKNDSTLDPKTKEDLHNKVNEIENELKDKTDPSAKDYKDAKEKVDKAINDAVIDKTIKKVKDYIDSIKDNNKYQPIVDKLDKSITDTTNNSNINNSKEIFDKNNKLLNDLANAKLDKTIIDANDLINKLKDKYPNEINKIKDLIDKINKLDKSNTKLVEEATKELVKEIINTKAKVAIKDAKDVLKDLNNSLVNPVDKINLSKEIKDLIKQINDLINDKEANENDINNLINQLNKAVDKVKDAIAKANYLDTKQKAKKEINNSNLSNDLKDKFNNLVDNIDKELNKIKNPKVIDYAKAKDKITNLVDKIKLEDAIIKAKKDKNNLINNNEFTLLPNNIKDPIIKAINDAINQTTDVLNNHPAKVKDQITKLNNKIKEQFNKAAKGIKLIKDLIDQTINHISNLPNIEPELINDLANKAKTLNNESSIIQLKDDSNALNDKHGELINKFNQANDLIDSDLFAKTNPDKQNNLTDAIEFIKSNKILGNSNKGLTNDHNQITTAIELLDRTINDIDGANKTNKAAWYLFPITLIASLAFIVGAIFTRKKK